jgi:hypothetical protein
VGGEAQAEQGLVVLMLLMLIVGLLRFQSRRVSRYRVELKQKEEEEAIRQGLLLKGEDTEAL